jgi:uncharacterized radical SAM superfamily protein
MIIDIASSNEVQSEHQVRGNMTVVDTERRLARAWQVRQAHFPMEIEFDYPLNTVAISLTGTECALDCAHCGGHYLQSMVPVWRVDAKGATSCLISGGCDRLGQVPVTAHLERIAALRPGRTMNWHVGLIEEEDIRTIAPYVDVISFDFVGDDETLREVYGLEVGVEEYVATYQLLRSYATVVPHITVGLRAGKLSGEYSALEMLAELGVEGLTFIVFIPTPGTRFAECDPPAPEEVAELLVEARLRFPDVPLHLGCLRPHGVYRERLDPLAVRAGVNVIVSPSRSAVALAQDLGLAVDKTMECCAVRFKREGYHERSV